MSKFLRYSYHFDTILLKRILVDDDNQCKVCAKKNKEKILPGKSSNERKHLLNHLSGDDLITSIQEFVYFLKRSNESDSYDLIDLNKIYENGDFRNRKNVTMNVAEDLFEELNEHFEEKIREQQQLKKQECKRKKEELKNKKKPQPAKKPSASINLETESSSSSDSETDSSSTTDTTTKTRSQKVYNIYPLKK